MLNNLTTNPDRPNSTWSLGRLEEYALARAEMIAGFGRKTIVETWLFGESLSYIHGIKKQDKTWVEWVKTQKYSLSTAMNAIKLSKLIKFEDLESCKEMTVSDLKATLGIIQEIPVKKRNKLVVIPPVTEQAADQPGTIPFTQADDSDATDSATSETTDISPLSPERHATVADYSRSTCRKIDAPAVGPTLTTSEVLGQALNLLLQAERDGVTADCSEILTSLAAKVAAMLETLNAVSA